MNRDSDEANMQEDSNLNAMELASQSKPEGQDDEEEKFPIQLETLSHKSGMYVHLTSIQAEAAMKHMPKKFILVERNKLK